VNLVCLAGVKVGRVHPCRVACNTLWSQMMMMMMMMKGEWT